MYTCEPGSVASDKTRRSQGYASFFSFWLSITQHQTPWPVVHDKCTRVLLLTESTISVYQLYLVFWVANDHVVYLGCLSKLQAVGTHLTIVCVLKIEAKVMHPTKGVNWPQDIMYRCSFLLSARLQSSCGSHTFELNSNLMSSNYPSLLSHTLSRYDFKHAFGAVAADNPAGVMNHRGYPPQEIRSSQQIVCIAALQTAECQHKPVRK